MSSITVLLMKKREEKQVNIAVTAIYLLFYAVISGCGFGVTYFAEALPPSRKMCSYAPAMDSDL